MDCVVVDVLQWSQITDLVHWVPSGGDSGRWIVTGGRPFSVVVGLWMPGRDRE